MQFFTSLIDIRSELAVWKYVFTFIFKIILGKLSFACHREHLNELIYLTFTLFDKICKVRHLKAVALKEDALFAQ